MIGPAGSCLMLATGLATSTVAAPRWAASSRSSSASTLGSGLKAPSAVRAASTFVRQSRGALAAEIDNRSGAGSQRSAASSRRREPRIAGRVGLEPPGGTVRRSHPARRLAPFSLQIAREARRSAVSWRPRCPGRRAPSQTGHPRGDDFGARRQQQFWIEPPASACQADRRQPRQLKRPMPNTAARDVRSTKSSYRSGARHPRCAGPIRVLTVAREWPEIMENVRPRSQGRRQQGFDFDEAQRIPRCLGRREPAPARFRRIEPAVNVAAPTQGRYGSGGAARAEKTARRAVPPKPPAVCRRQRCRGRSGTGSDDRSAKAIEQGLHPRIGAHRRRQPGSLT